MNKKQKTLIYIGTATVGYLGLRAAAVIMDPKVHTAVKNAGVAIIKASVNSTATK